MADVVLKVKSKRTVVLRRPGGASSVPENVLTDDGTSTVTGSITFLGSALSIANGGSGAHTFDSAALSALTATLPNTSGHILVCPVSDLPTAAGQLPFSTLTGLSGVDFRAPVIGDIQDLQGELDSRPAVIEGEFGPASGASLGALTDVTIDSEVEGQSIFLGSSGWENRFILESDIADFGNYADSTHTHSADDVISGTLSDLRLSSNVGLLSASNLWTGTQEFNDLSITGSGGRHTIDSLATIGRLVEILDVEGHFAICTDPSFSDGDILFRSGNGFSSRPIQISDISDFIKSDSKSATVESPTDSEDISLFFTKSAITISQITAVVRGTSPSLTFTIRHSTDRSSVGNEAVTGGTVANNSTTGTVISSFDDATIPANSYVWLETTAQSGTVDEFNVTLDYNED